MLGDFRRGAGIRLGPHFFTSDDELRSAVGQIVEIAETGAYRPPRRGDVRAGRLRAGSGRRPVRVVHVRHRFCGSEPCGQRLRELDEPEIRFRVENRGFDQERDERIGAMLAAKSAQSSQLAEKRLALATDEVIKPLASEPRPARRAGPRPG